MQFTKRFAMVAGFLAMAGAVFGQAGLSFTRRDLNAGAGTVGITSADFNGDGKMDIATTYNGTSTVGVLLGRGDGTFDPPRIANAGASPFLVFAADLNSDGKIDLLTTCPPCNTIAVSLGRGDGLFGLVQTFPSGSSPNDVAIADLNGDGKLDLAVANFAGLVPSLDGTTVSVLFGRGDGTFGPPSAFPAGTRPYALAAGDLNRDGKTDLVVATTVSNNVSVLIGNGNGTFQPFRSLPVVPGPQFGIAVSDLNLDGLLDVVSLSPFRVSTLLGNGDGTFKPATSFQLDGAQGGLVIGDINGDGFPDVATTAQPPYSAVLVALGMGDGSFAQQQAFEADTFPFGLVLGDFNQDRKTDVITVNRGTLGSLTVLLNSTLIPMLSPNAVVNAASFQSSPLTVAPGEIVTVFGQNMGPAALATLRLKTPDVVDNVLAGTRLLFDGFPAPLIYVRADQISAVVPYAVAGKTSTRVQVEAGGIRSSALTLRVAPSVPGIFSANSSGRGPAALLNQDGTLNSATNPAAKGSIVTFYMTGEGQSNPGGIDGKVGAVPLPSPILPLIVGIANIGAEVLYAGAAPGIVAGLLQVNVKVPLDAPSGTTVALLVKIGEDFSQPGITISIQ